MSGRRIAVMHHENGIIYSPLAEHPFTVLAIIGRYRYGAARPYDPPFRRVSPPPSRVENVCELYELVHRPVRIFASREAFT